MTHVRSQVMSEVEERAWRGVEEGITYEVLDEVRVRVRFGTHEFRLVIRLAVSHGLGLVDRRD